MIRRLAKIVAYSPRTQRLMERAETVLPPLRIWHRAQYERHFRKFYPWERLFQGVYPTSATALAAIPEGRPIGYDNPETATFLGQHAPMQPSEYPVLFWLARLLSETQPTVFDFGGYLGLGYNWYRPFHLFPRNLQWTIYDVPAVIEAGRRILEREPNPQLCFTTEFQEASACSILLAAGALHFEEEALASMLARLTRMPDHLLINKLPTTHLPTFYTLNNMGPSIAPYRITNRAEFIASLEGVGYELKDAWKNPEYTAYIPFHPDESVDSFDGMYFRLRELTPAWELNSAMEGR